MPSFNTQSQISPPGCIVHCRVSTPKQAYQGESLDVQAAICAGVGNARGWKLVHEPWKEPYSGQKEVRAAFLEILAFLDANPGKVRYYIFRSIDRFTRAGSLSYRQMQRELEHRGVEMVDSFGVIQPSRNTLEHLGVEFKWSRTRPSAISEVVAAESANQDVTNILTRLIGQEIVLRRRGYKIGPATDGFVNTRVVVDEKKHCIETPDPERAKYIVAMFELRAAGTLSDREICDRVNAMGYRSREKTRWSADHMRAIGKVGGTPLSPKRLQETIKRPIYCGIICEKWTGHKPIRAAYEGLVSIETFNAANRGSIYVRQDGGKLELLYNYSPKVRPHKKDNPLFPFKSVVLCPRCRLPFYGSSPRGRLGGSFPAYHCSRTHKYFGIPKATFENAVHACIDRLLFDPQSAPVIHQRIVELYEAQLAILRDAAQTTERRAADIKTERAVAVQAFKRTSTDAMRRALEEDIDRLDGEL